jgi:hypothetical protein
MLEVEAFLESELAAKGVMTFALGQASIPALGPRPQRFSLRDSLLS